MGGSARRSMPPEGASLGAMAGAVAGDRGAPFAIFPEAAGHSSSGRSVLFAEAAASAAQGPAAPAGPTRAERRWSSAPSPAPGLSPGDTQAASALLRRSLFGAPLPAAPCGSAAPLDAIGMGGAAAAHTRGYPGGAPVGAQPAGDTGPALHGGAGGLRGGVDDAAGAGAGLLPGGSLPEELAVAESVMAAALGRRAAGARGGGGRRSLIAMAAAAADAAPGLAPGRGITPPDGARPGRQHPRARSGEGCLGVVCTLVPSPGANVCVVARPGYQRFQCMRRHIRAVWSKQASTRSERQARAGHRPDRRWRLRHSCSEGTTQAAQGV